MSITVNQVTKDGIYLEQWEHLGNTGGLRGAIVHGKGEHSGRYHGAIPVLLEHGGIQSILAWDHLGHGQSDGKRGFVSEGLEDFARDTKRSFEWNSKPLDFVWAHSMGTLVMLTLLYQEKTWPKNFPTLFFLSGLPIVLGKKPNSIQRLILPIAKRLAAGLVLGNGLNATQISTQVEEQKRYISDPYVHDRISIRLYFSMLEMGRHYEKMMSTILNRFPHIQFFFAHGEKDTIALPEGTLNLKRYLSQDPATRNRAQFKIYPNSAHEIHHDKNRDAFFEDMLTWLVGHRPSS